MRGSCWAPEPARGRFTLTGSALTPTPTDETAAAAAADELPAVMLLPSSGTSPELAAADTTPTTAAAGAELELQPLTAGLSAAVSVMASHPPAATDTTAVVVVVVEANDELVVSLVSDKCVPPTIAGSVYATGAPLEAVSLGAIDAGDVVVVVSIVESVGVDVVVTTTFCDVTIEAQEDRAAMEEEEAETGAAATAAAAIEADLTASEAEVSVSSVVTAV